MNKNVFTSIKISTILITAGIAAQAHASGYHFGTQSVSSQATANSSAAEAADPSTIFYNPAGLTKLEGTQATINLNLVAPNIEVKDEKGYYPKLPAASATGVSPNGQPGTGEAIKGSTSDDIDPGVTFAPHGYVSHRLNDRTAIGLGIYVPFGSGTEYNRDSVLRYNLNELGLQTIAIQPTVAFKLNEQHSVAVGLIAQNTSAELRQYANFAPFVGKKNGQADGHAEVEGDDWGFGYNLAWMWDVNDAVRVGVNYRSKVEHDLKGTAKWHLNGDTFQDSKLGGVYEGVVRKHGYKAEESASVKVVTPESLSIHGMWKVDPKWNLFADATWTRHSRFNQAYLNYGNSKTVADPLNVLTGGNGTSQSKQTVLNPNWKDTWKFGVGASYQVTEPLQLRFGLAYDQSPVRSSEFRMSTLPDNDRIWFSVGGKYDINKHHTVNVAYSYIYIKDAEAQVNGYGTQKNAWSQPMVSSKTDGSAKFESNAHILGVQYTYKF